ncbi:MAG: hypothetical protein FWG99_08070 [Treponema sp.]|nr:hypothetical protein [Treponema sp.]
MVIIWYGLVPILGALYSRNKLGQFRRRFDELRLSPLLDYRKYQQLEKEGGIFRFIGGFESITDGHTLWIQGENLTIPVSIDNVKCWLLPMQEEGGVGEMFDPGAEAPERIRWDRVSTLTEGARVFVGGYMKNLNNRWSFTSAKEMPLMVIFYDCPDNTLPERIMRAWRHRNEYWNPVTPFSLIIGALSLLYMAYSFLNRPAFRFTVIGSLIALFIPILPMIPPGLIFMVLYRQLSWRARKLRVYSDIAALPLRHLTSGLDSCLLKDGEKYGCVKYDSLPAEGSEGQIPLLIPELSKEGQSLQWYGFGAMRESSSLPENPSDPFVCFGILPGNPKDLTRRYAIRAYTLEVLAWVLLIFGIALNLFFIWIIFVLLM